MMHVKAPKPKAPLTEHERLVLDLKLRRASAALRRQIRTNRSVLEQMVDESIARPTKVA